MMVLRARVGIALWGFESGSDALIDFQRGRPGFLWMLDLGERPKSVQIQVVDEVTNPLVPSNNSSVIFRDSIADRKL
jgi:hypothetical protein